MDNYSPSTSTSSGLFDTNSEPEVFADELKSIAQNLEGHIEYTEDMIPKGANITALSDQEINQFLEVASVYDEEKKLWRLPAHATSGSELRTPILKIILSILRFLGPKTRHPGRRVGTRTVVDTHAKRLCHRGPSFAKYSSPSLVIKASGPSFEDAEEHSFDFSGIATCIEVRPESDRKRWTSTDVVCQLGLHAKQIFIQQPNRRFVRCLVLTEQHVALVHFDRSGAQYTPFVDIHKHPHTLVRLVLTVSSLDERELGFDTSIRWCVDDGVKTGGTIGLLDKERVYTEYRMLEVHPTVMHYDIRSRGLRIWKVQDPETGELLYVKDAWIPEDHTPEYVLLERVKGIPGVVQMEAFHTCRSNTRAFRGLPIAVGITGHLPSVPHRRESRIVLEAYGGNVVLCEVEEQVIGAFRDVIAGLAYLREIGLYHRDISSGNVLLGKRNAAPGERGILIDLDMACSIFPLVRGSDDTGVGTYPYMSIAVLRSNYDHDLSLRQYRDHLDDLESVFYLFCESVFYWHEERAPPWWDSEDLYECAAAKLLMFCTEPEEFDTSGVDNVFGDVSRKLLKRFFAFIQVFVVKKEEINLMANPEEEKRERLALINSWEVHFDKILGIFDDALEELGVAPFDDVETASPPPSPTRTLAEKLDGITLTSPTLTKKSHL